MSTVKVHMNEKSKVKNTVLPHDQIDTSDLEDYRSNIQSTKPNFKQGNRYCWGGLPLWAFVILIVYTVLSLLAAILTPLFFIPITGSLVQKIVDKSEFQIVEMHTVSQDLLGPHPNVMIDAVLEIHQVSSASEGAVGQPSIMTLFLNGREWGHVSLPYVEMKAPVTSISAVVTIFITDLKVGAEALACPIIYGNRCVWTAIGDLVVKKKLAATTMYYGTKLYHKNIGFDIRNETEFTEN
eukprot:Awhi_evm1s1397